MPAKKSFNFENALDELEKLVAKLEQGDLSLEDSLQNFERGIALSLECQKALQTAKLKVEKLIEKNAGELKTTPFTED
jgi:exodeoxyribonuclease VII small subunit